MKNYEFVHVRVEKTLSAADIMKAAGVDESWELASVVMDGGTHVFVYFRREATSDSTGQLRWAIAMLLIVAIIAGTVADVLYALVDILGSRHPWAAATFRLLAEACYALPPFAWGAYLGSRRNSK